MSESVNLDLADIQGNILRAYSFPYGCYIFLNLVPGKNALNFVADILPLITTSELWPDEKPKSTLNIALSRTALPALDLPEPTINSFPDDFLQGMAERAEDLGDTRESSPQNWEDMWQGQVDVLLSVHAQTEADREVLFAKVEGSAAKTRGAKIIGLQNSNRLMVDGKATAKEHFGYTDGISQPEFKGSHSKHTPGDGKPEHHGSWSKLATGDFLIGYSNEAKEVEAYPNPLVLSKNGTYMVFRKLEQDVKKFRQYTKEWGEKYPGGEEKLKAKFLGRWPDGTPLSLSPEQANPALANDSKKSNDFTFANDKEGFDCPMGAHVRRANPRDSLLFHGKLTARRRIIRRGMSYGDYLTEENADVDMERGLAFIALNANISRQFEFIQQQWINYGNDFHLGEDADPVIGNQKGGARFVIPGDINKNEKPFICAGLPSFVTLKGGDYFFVPSLNALKLISQGLVDPR